MPDPVETLRLLVEVGVAVAGFSGVVVVLGRGSERPWSPIERYRLENLLGTSLTVLFLSLVALILLHAGMDPATSWRIGSALWAIVTTFELGVAARRISWAQRDDPDFPHAAWIVAQLGVSGLVVFLSAANVLVIREFWPFLAALACLFALAGYSFVRLLFIVGRGSPAA
jgi:hypothetical protein